MTHTNFPGKEYFAGRRTVRAFSDEIPSRELLNSILSDAMRAPNTGNMQLYSVIVTRDQNVWRRCARRISTSRPLWRRCCLQCVPMCAVSSVGAK